MPYTHSHSMELVLWIWIYCVYDEENREKNEMRQNIQTKFAWYWICVALNLHGTEFAWYWTCVVLNLHGTEFSVQDHMVDNFIM